MKNILIVSALVLLIGLTAQSALAQTNSGAKPSDKEMLIKAAQLLEQDPFHEKAKDIRSWAVFYVIETKDVSILVCGGAITAPLLEKKNKYGSELIGQYTIGMAAFKLANPDKAGDENAAQLAGLESVLRSYEAMVKAKPKAQFKDMDDLLAKRNNGELKKLVEDAKCSAGKKE